MTRQFFLLFCGLIAAALVGSEAGAQLMLPGAAPAAPQGATASPAKARSVGAAKGAGVNAKGATPGVAGLAGRPLMLNGKLGLLQISGDDKTATIEKLRLAGESVSDSSQRCVVDIVGENPIQATSVGRPDGLERFEVNVPACPFSFDVVDGAALAPSQITACVFKAADCQTGPGGLWGPDGASLVSDAAKFAKERAEAEKAMAKAVRAIEDRAKDSPEAADLIRDQNGFAGQRDDSCRDYAKESVHGYCALRLTEARTALLATRLNELAVAAAGDATSEKPGKTKPKKRSNQP
ncbi:MAG TPA: lysozyme inhibitor LprI family protein [Roseiarcus sp.]